MSGFFIVISGEHVSLCSWENSDFVTINLFDLKHRTADNGSGVVYAVALQINIRADSHTLRNASLKACMFG